MGGSLAQRHVCVSGTSNGDNVRFGDLSPERDRLVARSVRTARREAAHAVQRGEAPRVNR